MYIFIYQYKNIKLKKHMPMSAVKNDLEMSKLIIEIDGD